MGVTCALGQSHVPLDCVPHICSSQVAPGGLGKCLLHKHSTEITAPPPRCMPCPVLPHFFSLTQGGRAATPSGPRWQCYGDLQSAPSSKFPSHQQEFMPWVLGCPACTIWPGAKHLIMGLIPGVSQDGTTIQWPALVFPIEPGEGHPGLRIITPPGSCSVCQALPA